MRIKEKVKYYTKLYNYEYYTSITLACITILPFAGLGMFMIDIPKIQKYVNQSSTIQLIMLIGLIIAILAISNIIIFDSGLITTHELKKREFDYQFTLLSMYKLTKYAYMHEQYIEDIKLNDDPNLTEQEYEQIVKHQEKINKTQKQNDIINEQYSAIRALYKNANLNIELKS